MSGESSEESSGDSSGGNDWITLYHYTTENNAMSIKLVKFIRASDPDGPDAVYGRGVYLTSLGPTNDEEILANLWGDGIPKLEKLQYYVKVEISEDEVENVDEQRNIYLYIGDLNLNYYDHDIQPVQAKCTIF